MPQEKTQREIELENLLQNLANQVMDGLAGIVSAPVLRRDTAIMRFVSKVDKSMQTVENMGIELTMPEIFRKEN